MTREKILIPKVYIDKYVSNISRELDTIFCDSVAYPNTLTNVIFIGLMDGSLFFLADLMRTISFDAPYAMIKANSYMGSNSTGIVEIDLMGLDAKRIKNKTVVLVDEIVDTGRTLSAVKRRIKSLGASKIYTCVLLDKPCKRVEKIRVDFTGHTIEDLFVLGYGLDLDGRYRNVPYIFTKGE
jgi:hypoxanthine phosphoribosyltransferase